jgi:hypothetical protein
VLFNSVTDAIREKKKIATFETGFKLNEKDNEGQVNLELKTFKSQ